MKTSLYLCYLMIILLSCSKIVPPLPAKFHEIQAINKELIAMKYDNEVSMNDIHEVILRDVAATRNINMSYEVNSFLGEDADTLMYIVNLGDENGWKIYSSDKRTPAILAEGDKGRFSLEDGSPALAFWLESMARNIARVKMAEDDELVFNTDEIILNKKFWPQSPAQTLMAGPDIPLIPGEGHWEETIISTRTIEDTVVNHMVAQWDQNPPYNECCPYLTESPGDRAYAGCVAVAGAQVLHYLHYKIGVPEEMFSNGVCVGNIHDFYRTFNHPSDEVWDNMSFAYQPTAAAAMIPEAILIAYVGAQVNMHYNDLLISEPFSWAIPADLKPLLFEFHGISCSHGRYDENIVKDQLLNGMPVIVSASNLLIPIDFNIHCFVIDGYRKTRTEYTHLHSYVWDGPADAEHNLYKDYTTISYSPSVFSGIKINWGWWTQWTTNPVNDGWYTLTDSWVLNDGSDYDHYRKMIYNFTKS